MGQMDLSFSEWATALQTAEARFEAARTWWRRVMFDRSDPSIYSGLELEIREAEARRALIDADAAFFQLQGGSQS